jgi:hypothetical protein
MSIKLSLPEHRSGLTALKLAEQILQSPYWIAHKVDDGEEFHPDIDWRTRGERQQLEQREFPGREAIPVCSG